MLKQSIARQFSWIWFILAGLIAAAVLTRAELLIALSIGLAAGLSLADSI
jgi:hypothetical protein